MKPGSSGWKFHIGQKLYRVVEGEEDCELVEFTVKKNYPSGRLLVCDPPLGGWKNKRDNRGRAVKQAIHLALHEGDWSFGARRKEEDREILVTVGETPEEAVDLFMRVKLSEMVDLAKMKVKLLTKMNNFLRGHNDLLKKCKESCNAMKTMVSKESCKAMKTMVSKESCKAMKTMVNGG